MKKASDIDIKSIDTSCPEFQNVLKLISYTSQSVFLTGKAGTGKSTLLKYITATTKKKFVVLAPTGIAAVNAGGQTIHSFFKLPFKPMLPDDPDVAHRHRLKERIKYSREHVQLLRSLDLIIIDEVSMVRADTLDLINSILHAYCGNYRMPFAGKQMLLVGDLFQLEPVITGDMRDILSYYYKDGAYFFNAEAFKDLPIVPIELTKVYRQSDPAFIALLDRVRIGSPSQADIDLLNSKVIAQPQLYSGDFVMTLATRREIVDNINMTHLDALPGVCREYACEISGDFPDTSLPTDKTLLLKIDAQVVFVKNDVEKRWVNGTIGRVAELKDDSITIELEDGSKHAVECDIWGNVKYEYDEEKKTVKEIVIGTFSQLPVKLAWALTIHKSQGLTFDRAIIDVGTGAFSSGQSYVALSRCRSLDGLKLKSTINMRDIFVNRRILEYSRSFNNESLISQALEYAKGDDLYARAAAQFNCGNYVDAADLLTQAISTKNVMHLPNARRLMRAKGRAIASLKQKIDDLQRQVDAYREKFAVLAAEYVQLGDVCRKEGWEMQSAVANYDKAISLCPDSAPAFLGKGLALAQMGEFDDAMAALSRASALDPADYRPLYEAGCLVISYGDLPLGTDYLLRAIKCNGKVAKVHLALADAYEQLGEEELSDTHRKIAKKLSKSK